jgi:acyl-CoA synthetase (AMP-forming)/AMP-acid ligase II
MNLANLLFSAAETLGSRPAVSLGTELHQRYSELAERTALLAAGLSDLFGLRRGDHAALIMKNCPQCFEILFGLWTAGMVPVPINAKLHQKEFGYILDHSQSRLCFCSPDLTDILAPLVADIETLEALIPVDQPDYEDLFRGKNGRAPIDVSPHELAWLFYTSGTTGRPKGAMLTHRNLEVMWESYLKDIDEITSEDCIIHAAPLSHGSGMYVLPHVARGANNIIPASGGFDTAETIDLVNFYQGCSFFFAPTMVHRLIHDPKIESLNMDHLKNLVYGGGPMYLEDLTRALDILGPKLSQIYGQGEAPMTITGLSRTMHEASDDPSYIDRLKSAGVPRTGVEVRVFDDDDLEVPIGDIGEVVCRGEIVMAGYWRDPQATAEAMRKGWLHTGDLGRMDSQGFLTLKDRSKDMIISGGTNIYPREIEEILLKHDDVLEVSVIGRPHPDWGEEVIAFIVPKSGHSVSTDELNALCLDHIARFKRPKAYRFVDSLPKSNTGKVLKTELRLLVNEDQG